VIIDSWQAFWRIRTRPIGAIDTQLYARGQEILQKWIQDELKKTGKPVMCNGQSLGGAMALHAHIHRPEFVDYLVMNPSGLS
jgi:hypothetical protein